ncbi:MAG: Na+ dependent nucleoside transporter N-terminal domain-containing protein, partial [Bdellovibrio sp.]
MNVLIPICGISFFFLICWAFSSQRAAIDWRSVFGGMALQLFFALSLLGIPSLGLQAPLGFIFEGANNFVNSVLNSTLDGSRFLFGDLVQSEKMGFIFAFQVLPTIIFMASLTSVLYFVGLMQRIVQGLAWLMFRAMHISGAEALSVAADIFLGQTEAPLVIKPYLPRMTRSELFAVMSGGM